MFSNFVYKCIYAYHNKYFWLVSSNIFILSRFFFREKTARSNFCVLQAVFLRRSLWIDFESPFKVGGLTKAYYGAIHWVGSKIKNYVG